MQANAERGFTLIEVLVAFAILSITLLVLLEGTRRGLDAAVSAEAHLRLLAHAENRLASVGALQPLEPGIENGVAADHEWTLEIEEAELPAVEGIVFYAVTVTVSDAQGRRGSLVTLRARERLAGSAAVRASRRSLTFAPQHEDLGSRRPFKNAPHSEESSEGRHLEGRTGGHAGPLSSLTSGGFGR